MFAGLCALLAVSASAETCVHICLANSCDMVPGCSLMFNWGKRGFDMTKVDMLKPTKVIIESKFEENDFTEYLDIGVLTTPIMELELMGGNGKVVPLKLDKPLSNVHKLTLNCDGIKSEGAANVKLGVQELFVGIGFGESYLGKFDLESIPVCEFEKLNTFKAFKETNFNQVAVHIMNCDKCTIGATNEGYTLTIVNVDDSVSIKAAKLVVKTSVPTELKASVAKEIDIELIGDGANPITMTKGVEKATVTSDKWDLTIALGDGLFGYVPFKVNCGADFKVTSGNGNTITFQNTVNLTYSQTETDPPVPIPHNLGGDASDSSSDKPYVFNDLIVMNQITAKTPVVIKNLTVLNSVSLTEGETIAAGELFSFKLSHINLGHLGHITMSSGKVLLDGCTIHCQYSRATKSAPRVDFGDNLMIAPPPVTFEYVETENVGYISDMPLYKFNSAAQPVDVQPWVDSIDDDRFSGLHVLGNCNSESDSESNCHYIYAVVSNDKLSGGEIAAVIIAGVVALILIITVLIHFCCKSEKSKPHNL